MTTEERDGRIPDDLLTYHWLSYMHKVLGELQSAYRRQHEKCGLTQDVMAKRLGKDPSFISRCLRGHQNMTGRTMSNIARSMDCRLDVAVQSLSAVLPSNQQPPAPLYWQQSITTPFASTALVSAEVVEIKRAHG